MLSVRIVTARLHLFANLRSKGSVNLGVSTPSVKIATVSTQTAAVAVVTLILVVPTKIATEAESAKLACGRTPALELARQLSR